MILGRREGVLPAGSAYVVRFMVINALGPALLALLAFVLWRLAVPEPLLWWICSGTYLGTAAFFSLLSLRQERALRGAGADLMPRALSGTFWAGASLSHAIQLVNLVGYPAAPSDGMFLLGLWVLLVIAAAQFVFLLFASLR